MRAVAAAAAPPPLAPHPTEDGEEGEEALAAIAAAEAESGVALRAEVDTLASAEAQRWAELTSRAWGKLGEQYERHHTAETKRRVLYSLQSYARGRLIERLGGGASTSTGTGGTGDSDAAPAPAPATEAGGGGAPLATMVARTAALAGDNERAAAAEELGRLRTSLEAARDRERRLKSRVESLEELRASDSAKHAALLQAQVEETERLEETVASLIKKQAEAKMKAAAARYTPNKKATERAATTAKGAEEGGGDYGQALAARMKAAQEEESKLLAQLASTEARAGKATATTPSASSSSRTAAEAEEEEASTPVVAVSLSLETSLREQAAAAERAAAEARGADGGQGGARCRAPREQVLQMQLAEIRAKRALWRLQRQRSYGRAAGADGSGGGGGGAAGEVQDAARRALLQELIELKGREAEREKGTRPRSAPRGGGGRVDAQLERQMAAAGGGRRRRAAHRASTPSPPPAAAPDASGGPRRWMLSWPSWTRRARWSARATSWRRRAPQTQPAAVAALEAAAAREGELLAEPTRRRRARRRWSSRLSRTPVSCRGPRRSSPSGRPRMRRTASRRRPRWEPPPSAVRGGDVGGSSS